MFEKKSCVVVVMFTEHSTGSLMCRVLSGATKLSESSGSNKLGILINVMSLMLWHYVVN